MYLTQHWIFVISYLRVSVIFKLVFSFHNEKIQAELRRRELFVYTFGFVGYLSVGIPLILARFMDTDTSLFAHKSFKVLSMTAFASAAIVQSIAIYRIRKFSKMLVANQVFMNERFMCIHLFAFVWLATCKITISALGFSCHNET